jgi:hypothetical protein
VDEFLTYAFLWLCPLTGQAMAGQITHLHKCMTGPSPEIVLERIEAGELGAGCIDRFDVVQDCRIDLRDVAGMLACIGDEAACAGVCVRCAELNHEGTKATKENTKGREPGGMEEARATHDDKRTTRHDVKQATNSLRSLGVGRGAAAVAPRPYTIHDSDHMRRACGDAAPRSVGRPRTTEPAARGRPSREARALPGRMDCRLPIGDRGKVTAGDTAENALINRLW